LCCLIDYPALYHAETEEQSSSRKHKGGPPFVQVIEEVIPSFPERYLVHSSIMVA